MSDSYDIHYRNPLDGERSAPLEAQRLFHASPASFRAFVAGYGAGKTAAICMEALIQSCESPNNYGLIGRAELKACRAATMAVMMDEIIPPKLKAASKWSASRLMLTLPNESVIGFVGFQDPDTSHQGINIGWFAIDEAREKSNEYAFKIMRRRCRRPHVKHRLRMIASNPSGKGNWMYKMWNRHAEDPNWLMLDRISTDSNPHLPEDYIRDLNEDMGDAEFSQFYRGEWIGAEGPILESWEPEIHEVERFEVPSDWTRIRGMDAGLTNRTACVWAALNESDGEHPTGLYIYNEYMGEDVELEYNCASINAISMNDAISLTVVDPAARAKDPVSMISIFDQIQAHGIAPLALGVNDVDASIIRLRDLCAWRKDATGELTVKPRIYVMDHCERTAEQLESWHWEIKRGVNTGKPLKQDDDFVDCVRYIAMSLGDFGRKIEYGAPAEGPHQTLIREVLEQVAYEDEIRQMAAW